MGLPVGFFCACAGMENGSAAEAASAPMPLMMLRRSTG
jgi:hypothetical protein